MLAQIGQTEAGLDRKWGEELLRTGRHPEWAAVADMVWGPKCLREITHNLPAPHHSAFVGREKELSQLTELLSPSNALPVITINGIGGVGKTALALEAAHRCLKASAAATPKPGVPTFDAFAFVSAKQAMLTPIGIGQVPSAMSQRTLRDIFQVVAETLGRPEITQSRYDDQEQLVHRALAQQRTLLVIDNLETVEDKRDVLEFLHRLQVGRGTKVVITSREPTWYTPIRLNELSEVDGLQLIHEETRARDIHLTHEEAAALYRRTGGVPAAIMFAIGRMAAGISVESTLQEVGEATGDVARFCFQESVIPLRDTPAYRLLLALALFPEGTRAEAAVAVAGLEPNNQVSDALGHLERLALTSTRGERINMLPLTREFVLSELDGQPDFAGPGRERWVAWYLAFVKEFGGSDWTEWHAGYDRLQAEWGNLLTVFEWCAAADRYEDVRRFWRYDGVRLFTEVYGLWSDRIRWFDWLIVNGERRQEWTAVVEALSGKIWSLAVQGTPASLDEARALGVRAWQLRGRASAEATLQLATDLAWVAIRSGSYGEAHRFLDEHQRLLCRAELAEALRVRLQANEEYFRGITHFSEGHLRRAADMFRQVVERSHTISWQRAVVYAQNWLADIAMHRGNLDEAERLLGTGVIIAERNHDRRRVAHFLYSMAKLASIRRRFGDACKLSSDALKLFVALGMYPEAQAARILCQELAGEGTGVQSDEWMANEVREAMDKETIRPVRVTGKPRKREAAPPSRSADVKEAPIATGFAFCGGTGAWMVA